MKAEMHPQMKLTVVKCGCGAEHEVLSTGENMHVDICSRCHPFFTGEEKFVDTAGRVELFQRKYGKGQGQQPQFKAKTRTRSR
ncbi:50S ribosomal protein L31 [Candidatus Acetothermia bacterium]|nr:50S ribosomal protein L31 [Candidatus Acetothermia bacterium]MBI3643208.1 50S ribosomal protein L31 [Candidatus Acetothermia bacterium]